MKRTLVTALITCFISSLTSVSLAHAAEAKSLGVWVDHRETLIKCDIHLESARGKHYTVFRDCLRGSERFEGDKTPLRQMNRNRFRPADPGLGSWFYAIADSGDLEVRDSKGVIREIPSKAPKTLSQRHAKLRSEGVSVGMQKDEVLASSWGKPRKINRTHTARGTREQWVYKGGYLYFDGDVLVTIQN